MPEGNQSGVATGDVPGERQSCPQERQNRDVLQTLWKSNDGDRNADNEQENFKDGKPRAASGKKLRSAAARQLMRDANGHARPQSLIPIVAAPFCPSNPFGRKIITSRKRIK